MINSGTKGAWIVNLKKRFTGRDDRKESKDFNTAAERVKTLADQIQMKYSIHIIKVSTNHFLSGHSLDSFI